jgi:hypothetical protein
MIGDYLRSLEGIATLGIIGLLASVVLFVAIVIRVLRTPAGHIDLMARLPFDDDRPGFPHHHQKVSP